jgi:DNA primase
MRYPDGHVAVVLESLGIDFKEVGDELVARCPGHKDLVGKEDHKPSWSINIESGIHYCFSCHYKGTLFSLANEMRGRDFAVTVADKVERVIDEGFHISRDFKIPGPDDDSLLPQMPEHEILMFDRPPEWALKSRRISMATSEFFGVMWDTDQDAWILPFRDPDTYHLIGYQVKGEKDRSLVRNHPPGIRKSETLFGISSIRNYDRPVVLVESPLDAVRISGLGVQALAIAGSKLSKSQEEILSRFSHIILALDNDEAGIAETDRIVRSAPYFYFSLFDYGEGDYKDVGDMPSYLVLTKLGLRPNGNPIKENIDEQ